MAAMASTASSRPLLWLLCLISTVAWGGDWKLTSGITLSERYSDNVDLATTGLERSDWITEIAPRISARRDGRRLKSNIDYTLRGLVYAEDSDNNKISHNLNARLNAELMEDWFYLDANARISREPKTLTGGIGLGDGVGIGNTTSVGAYSISPYMKRRFGSAATVEARLSRDSVFIGDSAISDSESTRYLLSAVSGSHSLPLSWSGNYTRTDTRNSATTDTGSEHAAINARYQLSKKFGLLANVSHEKNDFTGARASVRDFTSYGLGAFFTPSRKISMDALYNYSDDGNFISGNITVSPTPRTTARVASSKRAFGRSHTLGLTHRTRKSNWSLTYRDELTTSQQQFLNLLGSVYVCSDGNTYLPADVPTTGDCALVPVVGQTQVNQTYLAKNLIGNVSYTLRRNTWRFSLFDNQREYQGIAGSDNTRGMQASWSLRPAVRTTFTLTGGMSRIETSTSAQEDELWNLALVATHQFQSKVSASVEARHQERKSNLPTGDYSENALAARLNMSF